MVQLCPLDTPQKLLLQKSYKICVRAYENKESQKKVHCELLLKIHEQVSRRETM